ncbi:hypothetical protein FZX09_03905 [Synechococcus sp. MU1643]|nr:hypothetical protein [Synechococcus sp. MU1643]
MKQLPGQRGKTLPRWLKTGSAGLITVMATIWLLSLLPFLLLLALLLSIALIPVTRRLRREIEEAGYNVDETRRSDQRRDLNITPWHRQLRNIWRDFSS